MHDPSADRAAIDAAAAQFFRAFRTADGGPDLDALYRLFIPQAAIVNNTASALQTYDLAGFIEPRRSVLTNGTLTDFSEEEISETTAIFENVAHRLCRYRKAWIASGNRHEGAGTKSLQFVRTPDGWRIASLVWEDDEPR